MDVVFERPIQWIRILTIKNIRLFYLLLIKFILFYSIHLNFNSIAYFSDCFGKLDRSSVKLKIIWLVIKKQINFWFSSYLQTILQALHYKKCVSQLELKKGVKCQGKILFYTFISLVYVKDVKRIALSQSQSHESIQES